MRAAVAGKERTGALMDQGKRTKQPVRRRLAGIVTVVAAIGSAAGWFLATVFEYLQWALIAHWTLNVTVVLVAVTVVGALGVYVWRDEPPDDDLRDPD